MEHALIERHDVIDRYLAGRLPEEEEARFEEHMLGCDSCFEQVKLEDGMREGFRALAAEEATRVVAAAAARSRLAAWLQGPRAGLLAAGVLALCLVPSVRLWQSNQVLRQESASAGAQAAAVEQRFQATELQLENVRRELADSQALVEQQSQALAQAPRPAPSGLEAALQQQRRAQINTPIHFLDGVRGEDDAPRLSFRQGSDWLLLAIELPFAEQPSYRAELRSGGRALWQRNGLEPDEADRLSLSLHRSELPAGRYRLRISGVDAEGRLSNAGEFPFEIAAERWPPPLETY